MEDSLTSGRGKDRPIRDRDDARKAPESGKADPGGRGDETVEERGFEPGPGEQIMPRKDMK